MEVGGSLLERVAVGNALSLVLAVSAFALSLGYLLQLGYRRHVGSDQKVGAAGRAVPQAGRGGAGARRWARAWGLELSLPSHRAVFTAGRAQGRGGGPGELGGLPAGAVGVRRGRTWAALGGSAEKRAVKPRSAGALPAAYTCGGDVAPARPFAQLGGAA